MYVRIQLMLGVSPMVYLAVNASDSFPVGLPLPVMRVRLANFCWRIKGRSHFVNMM